MEDIVQLERSSGLLLHLTSLPGRFGIGDLGPAAYRFVDFLAAAGQRYWQIMPLGPTGYGDSPYSALSAFAGNPLLVSPEILAGEGLLTDEDLADVPELPDDRVDYAAVIALKRTLLDRAFRRFTARVAEDQELRAEHDAFVASTAWLEDWALYAALREAHEDRPWTEWPEELARREPAALDEARAALAERIDAHRFAQFLFFRQWSKLRWHAGERGVKILGDMPIFVALDSADVWSRPELFRLDEERRPTVVAGVPPDAFSATGQLWGNPLYDWDRLRADGFAWWVDRVRETLKLVDVVRVDHFRGFAAVWEVPAGAETAEAGRWAPTPGAEIFAAIRDALGGELPIVAEDLGTITPDVHELRDAFGLPGMRVLQYAFGGDPHDTHLPHEYLRNAVAYTGTHDNDTVVGWWASRAGDDPALAEERARCLAYLGGDGSRIAEDFLRGVSTSIAALAVAQVQDVLGLGSEARMNTPASASGNWTWRLPPGALDDEVADRLENLARITGRLPPPREVALEAPSEEEEGPSEAAPEQAA